jgi:hypothetical protein
MPPSPLYVIKPYKWVRRLVEVKEKQECLFDGPAILDETGRVLNSSVINQGMHEVLEELLISQNDLFPHTITFKDDILSNYHVFRSFRRTSNTRALNQGVQRDDIDIVNRWHQVEKADGNRPSFDMRHHCHTVRITHRSILTIHFCNVININTIKADYCLGFFMKTQFT